MGETERVTVPKWNSIIQYCLVMDTVLSCLTSWHSDYSSVDTETYPIVISSQVMRPGCEAAHSTPSGVEVKNGRGYRNVYTKMA
jgi:hypothetical protein